MQENDPRSQSYCFHQFQNKYTLLEAPIRAVLKFKTNVRCNYEIAAKIRQSGPGTGSLVGRNTVIDDGVGCEETTSSLLHQE